MSSTDTMATSSQIRGDWGLYNHQQFIDETLHVQPSSQGGNEPPCLINLPPEILHEILSYLCAQDLSRVSMTCRTLAEHGVYDPLWAGLVNSHLPIPVQDSGPFASFRRLYLAHSPYWFIPQHKVWFADNEQTGNIVVARYDNRRGVIEAYRLLADRGSETQFHFWQSNSDVIIPSFDPTVGLWMDDPVLLLKDPDQSCPIAPVQSCKGERRMSMAAEAHHVFSSILLCSEQRDETRPMENGKVWPPLTIPSSTRIPRAVSPHRLVQPDNVSEVSHAAFRLRRWANFRLLLSPGNNQTLLTYATLDPSLYTPTKEKPYQGIWVGDYSAHGSEFLLFLQQDSPAPDSQPDNSSSNQDDEVESDNAAAEIIHQGSLAAIKLTGDPNVPRGEISFASDDIGPNGLICVADEKPFEGARIVQCSGHVAGIGFRDDSWMDSQLILMSPDYVAHYWQGLGHISYYRRVDIDALIQS